ncbi:ATP-binding protein [Longimicrobium sp.]|uniref:ATP-binding protein n=1 Tax=Longimicrobium sp. TaxID=2029185 RepID=UPI002E358BBE|nr:ATP-binding protein [Longimicrobium sp.]HEX6039647.1 ATP-binding protein [Longimicrobium sp.]
MPHRSLRSRRFVLTFAFLLAVVVLLIVLANETFRGLSSANRWSLHTYQVLDATHEVQEGIAEMESGFRGYALTRDPRFLEQWRAGLGVLQRQSPVLRRLTRDNPAQQRRLDAAERAARDWLRLQAESGVLRPETTRDQAIAVASDPRSAAVRSEAVERVRRAMDEVESAESGLLRERADRAGSLERRTRLLLLAGSLLAIGLAIATALMVHRRTRRLAELNHALEGEVAERALARDALVRISRQNELILDAAAEGIYGLDPQGYTLFLNPAAARMLGRSPDDVIGRPFEAVLGMGAAEAGGEGVNPVRATLGSGVAREVKDAVFRRADGTSFPVEYASTPIVEDGRITGAVVTFRDVTERREVERMKDEFVSVVSHELRTPLTSIRGSLGLLAAGKMGEVPEKGRRMLEIAVQNTDRLVRLINDILDIERIESGRVTMELRAVDASDLAHQSVDVMSAMAEKLGVKLYAWADRQPLEADPDRILQVLTNLLSNAIKFSPPGAEVSLTVERGDGEVVFRVRDQGRGIPADRLESIFERFSQVDSSDARDKGGTGLGLAICRSIVQQHGGRIWVESQPGEGSTFTFTLPAPFVPEPRPVEADDGEGPLILVCDDDSSVLIVVEEILRGWGYRTVGVQDGQTAVREAVRLHPDAILLDMMMPGMTGSDTLTALRQRPDTRSIPVVILSALKPMPRVQHTREVVDWVEKPFKEQGLLHALEEAVSVRWKPRRVLLVEDDPDLARVLLEVFGRHGIEALHAPTGVEAVEQVRRAAPDLLVLDLGLPHGDGYWVVDSLRGSDALRGIPMVVYTARELEEDDRERLRLGHTEFLTKGRVSPDEFEKRVVSLLNRIAPARHTTTAQ